MNEKETIHISSPGMRCQGAGESSFSRASAWARADAFRGAASAPGREAVSTHSP